MCRTPQSPFTPPLFAPREKKGNSFANVHFNDPAASPASRSEHQSARGPIGECQSVCGYRESLCAVDMSPLGKPSESPREKPTSLSCIVPFFRICLITSSSECVPNSFSSVEWPAAFNGPCTPCLDWSKWLVGLPEGREGGGKKGERPTDGW